MSETRKRQKKERQSVPSINGTMSCDTNHSWIVLDLNPERVNVSCPVCGSYTSIKKGFKNNEPGRI